MRNEEPNAAADLRNIEFVMEPHAARVTWPDGTERIYRRISTLFRLEKELLPNGKTICYQYGSQGQVKVTASDAEGKYLYGSIEQVNENHYVGSDGRKVHFDRMSVKVGGKKKEHRGKRSFSFMTQLLCGVQSPYYDHLLHYNDRTLLSFYDAKSYPVSFDYAQNKGEEGRIVKLSTPSGSVSLSYDPPVAGKKEGSTTVVFENGAVKVYRFDQRLLLTAIENRLDGALVNQKTFSYDSKQHLCALETRDGSGTLLIAKRYECDAAGNPLVECIEGDFGSFSIRKTFSKNRVIKEEREDGFGVEYDYLGNTHLITSKTLLDHGIPIRTTTYRYDEANNLIEEDEVGRSKTRYFLYQSGQHLHRVCEKEKRCWDGTLLGKVHYTYDSWGNLSEEHHFGSDDQLAYVIHKKYNAKGELLEETNALGQTARYEYAPRSHCVLETPFSQLLIERTFDAKGRMVLLKEGDHLTHFSYNSSDQLIEKKDYLGFVASYSYDPVHGKLVRIEAAPVVEQIKLDPFGREVERIDAQGAKTQKRYNSYGDPIEIVHPDGGKETSIYASNGRLISHLDADGLKTSYGYDVLGRLLFQRQGELLTSYKYDPWDLLEEVDPLKVLTSYRADCLGRRVEEQRAGRVTRMGYDPLGFLAWKERGGRRISYTRDVMGRPLKKSIDALLDTEWSYDAFGNVATKRVGEGVFRFSYDRYGRLIEKVDPELNRTSIDYLEGDRQLTKRTEDPRGVVTTETYDPHGLLVKRMIGEQALEEFSYDSALRLSSQDHLGFSYTSGGKRSVCSEAGIRDTKWGYTPGGKISFKQKPDGSLLHYEYDSLGRLTKVADRQFQYDELDRLIGGTGFVRKLDAFGNILREEWSTGLWIESSYDDWNRPLERILCDNSRVVYEYEGPFLKRVVRYDNEGTLLYIHTYQERDAAGHVLSEKDFFSTFSTYNKRGAKTSQINPYFNEEISYDAAGNVIQRGLVKYAYDDASRLTFESGKFAARYDLRHNCIEKNGRAIALDTLNQLQEEDYDANGNLLRPGYVYDSFDQLVEAGGERSTYDALGRRILKGNTAYLYVGDEEIGSFENGKFKELKILGEDGIVAIEIEGCPYAPVQDVQGTIRLLVDGKTGEIVKRNDCDAFGVGLTDEIPYAYAGKRYDAASGVYFGQRTYDPSIGRWLSRDPLWAIDHSNLYQYVFNNPFRYQDPMGQSVGGYLLGLGEILLGGSIVVGGFALEVVTIGGFTCGLGVTTGTGMLLMGHGLSMTTYHAQDIKYSGRSYRSSSRSGYVPNYTSEFGYLDEGTVVWKNTNPFEGPVDEEVLVGDAEGNIIPVPTGYQLGGSKDGKCIQQKDRDGEATGIRKDGKGHPPSPVHRDPRSQNPHGHVPGVTNPDGTPWLPIY